MASPSVLTSQELQLLQLLSAGATNETMSRALNLSERTLRRHVRQICDRLGVSTPIEAVVWAVRQELI